MTHPDTTGPTETERVEALVAKARQVVTFLHGEAGLGLIWFGQEHPDHDGGPFWWRSKHLPEIEAALDAQTATIAKLRAELEELEADEEQASKLLLVEHERANRAEAALDRANAALERTLNNFEALLAGKPVRDAAETIGEARRALAAGGKEDGTPAHDQPGVRHPL